MPTFVFVFFFRVVCEFIGHVPALNQCISQDLAVHYSLGFTLSAHYLNPDCCATNDDYIMSLWCSAELGKDHIWIPGNVSHYHSSECRQEVIGGILDSTHGMSSKIRESTSFGTIVGGSEKLKGRHVNDHLVDLHDPWHSYSTGLLFSTLAMCLGQVNVFYCFNHTNLTNSLPPTFLW